MALVNPENIAAQARGFNALPVLRQIGLMIGLAASVALGVAVVLWSRTPDYSMLYGRLSDMEAAQVTASLDSAGIPYRIERGSGAITVPSDKVHEARLKLATRGLPRGDGTGFELLDGDQGFGTSQFMEQARYNRAIEGELARSISTLKSVESARVHLAIPKRSVFVRDRNKPQASVVLKLFSGARLDAEDVTVVDQNGRLLTANNGEHGMAASASHLAYRRKLEQEYIKRIEDILIPVLGEDGVRAQVAADIDFTIVESTTESYQPDDRAIRSEETFEESTTPGMAAGVPGALTNQPPPAGQLDDDATARDDQSKPVNSTRRATRNYELDRSISHTRNLPGAIKQLSVAVLVDYRTQADDKGKSVRVPLADDEITRITDLVKEAVGFSEERNDSIQVSNIPFRSVEEVSEAFPETPLWQQPWVGGVVKQVIGAIFVLFLLFGVLRPVLRSLAVRPEPAAGAAAQGALPPAMAGNPRVPGEDRLSLSGQQPPASPEQQFGMARSMIDSDPRRVAGVVKDWVATDG